MVVLQPCRPVGVPVVWHRVADAARARRRRAGPAARPGAGV